MLSTDSPDTDNALVCPLKKHTGSVKGLQFNPFSPNLLASGGSDSEVCIWDIASPAKPTLYPSLADSGNSVQNSEITDLAWNCKVQHILASTSSTGSTVVWDLKRQKQVISFSDPGMGRRCSALQWNPEVATQLIVASDDDRSPSLQVWDLRNSISPLKEFTGHTKGVLSLAWSTLDHSLLLSSGKDNRTVCWDTYTGEILCELPSGSNWNFDLKWCNSVPGWFSTASFDGIVSLYNLTACMGKGTSEVNTAADAQYDFGAPAPAARPTTIAKRAPNWLGRPCGVACGFGGKFVSFSKKTAPQTSPNQTCGSVISISSAVVEKASLPDPDQLKVVVSDTSKPGMHAFCSSKCEGAKTETERETWEFLKVLFEDDARKQILSHLGYETETETQNENGVVKEVSNMTLEEPVCDVGSDGNAFAAGGDEAFFDNLNLSPRQTPTKVEESPNTQEEVSSHTKEVPDEEEEEEVDQTIKNALFLGKYDKAVAHCIELGNMADALLIASIGGPELWASTQKEYMKRRSKGYIKILSSIMNHDFKTLISQQKPSSWRETLALLCTYAETDEWPTLCSSIGDSLMNSNDVNGAVLCYICGGNLDSAVRLWSQSINAVGPQSNLNEIMEKSIVMSLATSQQESDAYADLLNMYVDLLSSNGQMNAALEFLNNIPGQLSESTNFMKERLHQAGAQTSSNLASEASTNNDASYYQEQMPTSTYAQQPSQSYGATDYTMQGYNNSMQQQPSYQSNQYSQPQMTSQPPVADQSSYYQGNQQYYQQQAQPQKYAQDSYAHKPYIPSQPPTPMSPQQSHIQTSQQPAIFNPAAAQAPSTQSMPAQAQAQPTAQPQVFMPMQAQQPPVSSAPKAKAPPPKPAAPQIPANINISNADVSSVPQDMKGVVACLKDSYNLCASAYANNPSKKREVEDNSRRLGILFFKLNLNDVKPSVKAQLQELCKALGSKDFAQASKIHISLTTTDFDECGQWLTALKRLIKTRQMIGQ